MVADGVFHGIYEGTALVAAAGTHLLAREEGAAAIGNVYTRRDRRGRGLGRLVTSAVLGELAGVETIGLNVRADNDAALHLYESLGFARHCQFYEALAMPSHPDANSCCGFQRNSTTAMDTSQTKKTSMPGSTSIPAAVTPK